MSPYSGTFYQLTSHLNFQNYYKLGQSLMKSEQNKPMGKTKEGLLPMYHRLDFLRNFSKLQGKRLRCSLFSVKFQTYRL